MKQGDNVLYQRKKYMVFATKGGYVTIGNGDYNHYGEDAITVDKKDVKLL